MSIYYAAALLARKATGFMMLETDAVYVNWRVKRGSVPQDAPSHACRLVGFAMTNLLLLIRSDARHGHDVGEFASGEFISALSPLRRVVLFSITKCEPV